MKRNTVVYCVDDVHSSFILSDIVYFAKNFKTVLLFSTGKVNVALPENVVIYQEYLDWKKFRAPLLLLSGFFSILSVYVRESLSVKRLLPLRQSVSLLASNLFKAKEIERLLKEDKRFSTTHIGYSFWFYDCIFLAWLKKRNVVDKAYTRAHGGDLFEERGSLGPVLFRHFQLGILDAVFSVSDAGRKYLQDRYPWAAHKISTFKLGTRNHKFLSPHNDNEFTVVSCAVVRNIKRIHLLAEAINNTQMKINWYHIGKENLDNTKDITIRTYKENKEKISRNPLVRFTALGELTNNEVFEFYKNTPVNLFISVSQAEGVPVSMMEAISFGIPVLSTDVGGCAELVTNESGMLISPDADSGTIIKHINDIKASELNTPRFRERVKNFWRREFNIENNYASLFAFICNN